MRPLNIAYWMTRFILEVRKIDAGEYQPNTLYHITCGLMRHLRTAGYPTIDFFKDKDFAEFKASLDSEMKRLQSKGLGSKRKQAEPFTVEEENTLWEHGILGVRL